METITKKLKILVTGAAGQIAYSFIPMLCSGEIFGETVGIELNLLDLPEKVEILKSFALELQDCCFELLKSIEYGADENSLFKNAQLAIFLGGQGRKPGMERNEYLEINSKIFQKQGKILNQVADSNCKILVVANPVLMNCSVLMENCPNIPKNNFTCLTRLEFNRAKFQIAKKLNCSLNDVKKLIVWGGNHSTTIYPDVTQCTIKNKSVLEEIDNIWIENDFIKKIQKRGAEIMNLNKQTSVISAAYSIKDHLKDWYFGTQLGDWCCMGVLSEDFYNIPENLFFSVPVTCSRNFEYEVVKDVKISEKIQKEISYVSDEIVKEKEKAFKLLN